MDSQKKIFRVTFATYFYEKVEIEATSPEDAAKRGWKDGVADNSGFMIDCDLVCVDLLDANTKKTIESWSECPDGELVSEMAWSGDV